MRRHDWECGPIITASAPAPRNRGGPRDARVANPTGNFRGRGATAVPPVPSDALKNVEPSFAALRWFHGTDVRHGGHWQRKASSKGAQAQLPMRDGPASTRCAETFYRRGKGSLAIARSAAIWAGHCGQSMSRTSRRTFPGISRICSNGWTNANGVRAGPRHVRPALLEDTVSPDASRLRPAARHTPARHPFSKSSRSKTATGSGESGPPTAGTGSLRARYRSCSWARGRR